MAARGSRASLNNDELYFGEVEIPEWVQVSAMPRDRCFRLDCVETEREHGSRTRELELVW